MSFLAAIPIVGRVLDTILGVVDKAVVDKDERERLRAALQAELLRADFSYIEKELDARAQILVAEIKNESWLTRNWRPLLMLTCIAIIANNYVFYPYLTLFGVPATPLELPTWLADLMKLGVGGYIVGRTGEKLVDKWKGNDAQ